MDVRIQLHLDTTTSVSAALAGENVGVRPFGYLNLGPVMLFLPGRDAEIGPSARELANKISAALYAMAAEADVKAAAAPAADEEPLAEIAPAEIPF